MASRTINMTFPEALLKEVDSIAGEEGRTRSEFFREAIRYFLKRKRTRRKSAAQVLSRIASHAVKGPRIPPAKIDEILYGARAHR